MTYASVQLVKLYAGIDKPDHDTLISLLLDKAQVWFESETGRVFASVSETRRFDALDDVDGDTLYLDKDLVAVNTLTNGDGAIIASTSYVLLPANETPKYAVKIKSSSGASWTYSEAHEEAISVNGSWAYSDSPPEDVVLAVLEMTSYLYHQRSTQTFEVTAIPEAGIITIPQGIPTRVLRTANKYKRNNFT